MHLRPFALCLAVLVLAPAGHAWAGDGFFLSIRHESKRDYYVSVATHFRVSEADVAFAYEKRVPDDEMPVVFFLAARAKVKPRAIIELRLAKKSWASITASFGLGADIFYVPVKTIPGPPYGKAWGHYRKHPRSAWRGLVLPDAHVVTLVNVGFISKRHGYSPDAVVKLGVSSGSFLSLHANFKAKAKAKAKRAKAAREAKAEKRHRAAKPRGKGGRGSKGGHGGGKGGGKGRK